MKKIFIIILSLISFLLQAQDRKEIADEAMKSWIGSNEHDVVMQFGSPTSTTSDGANGKIIRYSQTTSTVVGTPVGGSVIGTNVEQVQFYEFYINSGGIVYSYKTNMKFTKRQAGRIHKKENSTPQTQYKNNPQQQNSQSATNNVIETNANKNIEKPMEKSAIQTSSQKEMYQVTSENLDMSTGVSILSNMIMKIHKGAVVELIEKSHDDRWKIRYNDETGYVNSKHLSKLTDTSTQSKNNSQQKNQPNTKSKIDKLRELKQMLDEKLITQDEYAKEKKKILDEKE